MITEINRLAALAHWVLPGLSEGRLLTGFEDPADIAAFYLDQGAEAVAIKLGPQALITARTWMPVLSPACRCKQWSTPWVPVMALPWA